MYIWERKDWQQGKKPAFVWDDLSRPLAKVRTLRQKLTLPHQTAVDLEAQLDALIQTALRTSEIEGEVLNVESVRSSVVRKLGLGQGGFVGNPKHSGTPQTDALIQLLVEAMSDLSSPMSVQQLCDWQRLLFPTQPLIHDINIGALRGDEPMQVVSGRIDRPIVHFEAPPRDVLDQELDRFVRWFNQPPRELEAELRAGVAHLWFVTLHPFDDGNGRLARAITDRVLAQAEDSSIRFYSLSEAIMARRSEYYDVLETTQKGSVDITAWLTWFLSVLADALEKGLARIDRVMNKTAFWQRHAQTVLSERQIRVLNRLLDSFRESFVDGLNARHYMRIAQVSKATATRDLSELLEKGCLERLPGGGRSTRYKVLYPRN